MPSLAGWEQSLPVGSGSIYGLCTAVPLWFLLSYSPSDLSDALLENSSMAQPY